MKTQNLIFIGLMSTLMFGCGEEDPFKDYQNLNTAVAPYKDKKSDPEAKNQLFFIDVKDKDQLSFVQGVSGEVQFSTRLAFSNPSEVKYDLKMIDGPSALGAVFVANGDNSWVLKWRPSANILTSTENYRKLKLIIQFVLQPQSSPFSKAQFAGQVDTREFELILNKDQSIPVIEDDVQFDPAATLNPDQSATIRFTAAAKGLPSAESLQINLFNGPSDPSSELAQITANMGIVGVAEREKRSPGVDPLGRTRHQYKLVFAARTFVDKALVKIRNNERLHRKLLSGELKELEAAFFVEAVNSYNGMRSAQKMIILKVNIAETAGLPLLAGLESITVQSGAVASQQFFIRSSDSRSEIIVDSLQIGEQLVENKNGEATLTEPGVNIKLKCSNGTPGLNEQFNCKAGKCYQSCQVTADIDCEAANNKISFNINAESKMGTDFQKKALPYSINIKGKSKHCAPVAVVTEPVQGEK